MAKRVGLLVVSFGMTLLMVEAVVRQVLPLPSYHREPLEIDSVMGFRGIPSHRARWVDPENDLVSHEVVLNRDGFRGREVPRENAPKSSARRIAFLGDSFLVGESVPEEALLTSRVRARWPIDDEIIEVYNLSTIDYGTGQELLLLDQLGEAVDPDVVALMIYPANDVANNAIELAGRTRVGPGDAIRPYLSRDRSGRWRTDWTRPWRARARGASRVFAWIERGLFAHRMNKTSMRAPEERLRAGRPPRESLEVYARHLDPGHRWEIAWRKTEALVRAIRDRCRELDAELVVGVIPDSHQVRMTPQRIRFEIQARLSGKELGEIVDWSYPERRLSRMFEAEGIPAVLMLDEFRREARAGRRLYSRDRHLSPDGHEVAARSMFEVLHRAVRGKASGGERRGTASRESVARSDPDTDKQRSVDWAHGPEASWLELGEQAHGTHFGDGWLRWQREREGQAGGWWLTTADALVVLRPGEGEFVLRGTASGPTRFEVGFLGGSARRFEISSAGPFEVRLDPGRDVISSPSGHVAVVVNNKASGNRLLIHSIGFPDPDQ